MASEKKSVLSKSDKAVVQEEDRGKKRERIYIPLTFFYLKDLIREFVNNKNFPDSALAAFALASVAIALPFYPLAILIPLIIVVFVLARLHPFAGLYGLLFLTFPMVIYQAPLMAWYYAIFLAACLFVGYRHTDTITLSYALIALPFSALGYIVEIPTFIMGVLFLGLKRASIAAVVTILVVAMLSGVTGIALKAPISYATSGFRSSVGNETILPLLTPSLPAVTFPTFLTSFSSSIGKFFNYNVAAQLYAGLSVMASALSYNIEVTLLQVIIWLAVVFSISSYLTRSRSPYKGTESSLYCFIILAAFLLIGYFSKVQFSALTAFGFIITPFILFMLEVNDVQIVRTLDVMKRDFLAKFGEAFEELTSGTHETLNDIADYESTKQELREAILEPTEHREIKGAYNIRPAKGILLFGPPGTGKTLIMRALSNEIRARFFYVKTSSLISSQEGESVQMLSRIFTMVKKHQPSVLFFDEIDGIAAKRGTQTSDTSKQILSMLLAEMDGFQKLEGVVVIGSTNVPQLLDPSILRPGRFDKIIYMPLPDRTARIAVFKYYSKKYPMSSDVDCEKLADLTQRFSNADIANICAESARQVAEEALKSVKILKIDMSDIVKVIKATKPSTSLSRVAEYERFKLDYERRLYQESSDENLKKVSVDDVVGLDDAKKALYEALEVPILHPQLVKDYDIKGISGILLYGPPGTGKTMLMSAVANEIGEYRMITLSGADIIKEGYDKAVETIHETFERAEENAPSIIFIDEVDSLVPSREGGAQAGVQITAEFLREFDSVKEAGGVVLVGSTNRPDAIDSAMIRPGRFDKLIYAPPPNKDARAVLFKKNLGKAPLSPDFDFDDLARKTKNFTGADIANICREAKMGAVEKSIDVTGSNHPITTKEIEDIIENTTPSAPDSALRRYQNFVLVHGRK